MVTNDDRQLEEDAEKVHNDNLRIDSLVDATLRGEMGRGEERKKNLGEDYAEVIRRVKSIRNQNGSNEGGLDPDFEEVPDSELEAPKDMEFHNQGQKGLN